LASFQSLAAFTWIARPFRTTLQSLCACADAVAANNKRLNNAVRIDMAAYKASHVPCIVFKKLAPILYKLVKAADSLRQRVSHNEIRSVK
jgi:hypothetical protein